MPPEQPGLISESDPVAIRMDAAPRSNLSMPHFASGVIFFRYIPSPEITEYFTYSRSGEPLARFTIEVPGAGQTIGSRITALPDASGYVAVAIAVNGGERVATLCFLDRSGRLQRTVKTSPPWPYQIAVAADRTIWGFGAASQPPFEVSVEEGEPAILSSGDRVVVYSPHTRQLCELALDGAVLGSFKIPLPDRWRNGQNTGKSLRMGGMALTKDGVVYAYLRGGENGGLYEFDRLNRRWVPSTQEVLEKYRMHHLIGASDEGLALISASPTGPVSLKMVRLTKYAAPAN